MSQYPIPYATPPFDPSRAPYGGGHDPLAAALRPARRAAILMWVFGGLCLLGGLCVTGISQVIKSPGFADSPQGVAMRDQIQQAEAKTKMPFEQIMIVEVVAIVVPGVVMIALAFWVRGGGAAASIVGAVVTGIFLAGLAISFVSGVLFGGGQQLVTGACMLAGPAALLVFTMRDLVRAARAAPYIAALRQQFRGPFGMAAGPTGVAPGNFGPGYSGYPAPPQQQSPPGYGAAYGAAPSGFVPPWQGPSPAGPSPAAPFPAPFGGGYGYAQGPVPPVPQPPAGDTPIIPAPLTSAPAAPPSAAARPPEARKEEGGDRLSS